MRGDDRPVRAGRGPDPAGQNGRERHRVLPAGGGATPTQVGHWEQGRRTPTPMARRLLNRIAADPAGLLAALVRRPNGGRTAPDTRTGSSSPQEVVPPLPVVRRSHLAWRRPRPPGDTPLLQFRPAVVA